MYEQRWLEFVEEERLEKLWEGFPEDVRDEVTQQYARLMARLSVQRLHALRKDQEVSDEPSDS